MKFTALYKRPEDVDAFEQHYFNVHVPLAGKMPGLIKMEMTRFISTPMDEESPYYLQTDLFFEDMEALKTSMASPEGKAAAKDIWKIAGKISTMILGETVEIEQMVSAT